MAISPFINQEFTSPTSCSSEAIKMQNQKAEGFLGCPQTSHGHGDGHVETRAETRVDGDEEAYWLM